MSSLVIQGGHHLSGEIDVYGSKNAALPLLAATLLTKEEVKISNIPQIIDVTNLLKIFSEAGAQTSHEEHVVTVNAEGFSADKVPEELIGKLRGSILLLGALLGRQKKVELPLPGGDIIGARPIDVHLDGFKQLGAEISEENGKVKIDGSNMKAGHVVLREFSVTATENILLAAASLPGKTTIEIAATEPHVVALCDLLEKMGAQITGAGTHTIEITGSENLHGTEFTNIFDMLEAGFFILLAAATQSEIVINNVPVQDLTLFFKKLEDIGVDLTVSEDKVTVKPAKLKPFKIQSLPQPGIATDLQAPFAVLATQAQGASLIHDPMYEARFKHCDELKKMGAQVTVCDPHRVIIEGPNSLRGQEIKSLDIRSGATLVLAGLIAEGETVIGDAEIIDRGYENLEGRLRNLGAKIERR